MVTPQRFRKRPIEVEAMRWDGTQEGAVAIVLWSRLNARSYMRRTFGRDERLILEIETRDGIMEASPGDWVIREPFPTDDRRFYPCKPDIFEATYEAVDDTLPPPPLKPAKADRIQRPL